MSSEPWPAGTRVEKINSKPSDTHSDGARGTIVPHPQLGHYIGPLEHDYGDVPAGTFAYFVEWDDFPGVPVGITGTRIRRVDGARGSSTSHTSNN